MAIPIWRGLVQGRLAIGRFPGNETAPLDPGRADGLIMRPFRPSRQKKGIACVSRRTRLFTSALLIVFCAALVAPLIAAAAPKGTGLPLPRFVSLRAEKARLRTGPGVQYPEEWIYLRQDLPLEIIAEHHTWRKVRDWQGTQGWMHQSLLSGRRTLIVTGATRNLRQKPDSTSHAVARVEAGVVGQVLNCGKETVWCEVEIDGFKGWLRRIEFWGVYPDEVVE
jgi:SH3-like domain-containing protein